MRTQNDYQFCKCSSQRLRGRNISPAHFTFQNQKILIMGEHRGNILSSEFLISYIILERYTRGS